MLIIGSILLLLANAVTLRREKSILFNRVAVLILLYSGILAYDSLYIESLDTGIGVFSGLFHSTAITHSFDIFIYFVGAVILQLTAFYPRRLKTSKLTSLKSKIVNKNEEQYFILEYPLVILFILIGATFLMASSDLVSMFIALELQSYGLYILATLYRNSELSTTAGLTYFLLGGLSSCFILLGSSLLYLNSGLTDLNGIYILSSLIENKGVETVTFIIDNGFIKTMNINSQSFNLALLIMSIGYLFKVSAAPFHF
jgi:NADH-ubiquinone oxidoreductase chain 2